ncbi:carbohydrate esterase family 5 protein [Atractiella rhizophila]|nr:carbohydrate esterase family 5 protein [Atractiella rhizophila]
MLSSLVLSAVALFALVKATPLPGLGELPESKEMHEFIARQGCSRYLLINTRGTTEVQGPSAGFVTMSANVRAAVSGGREYDTVYPAGWDQNSAQATTNILAQINTGASLCPDQVYVLLGYSQGAAATYNALQQLSASSTAGKKVAAVFVIGNPERRPGFNADVDNTGGSLTDACFGIESSITAGLPRAWDSTGKVLDVCYPGDGVCCGLAITAQHLLYPSDPSTQALGTSFITQKLKAAGL